jgi:hypothetical protein
MIKIIFEIIPPIDFKDFFFARLRNSNINFYLLHKLFSKSSSSTNLNAEFFMIFLEQKPEKLSSLP